MMQATVSYRQALTLQKIIYSSLFYILLWPLQALGNSFPDWHQLQQPRFTLIFDAPLSGEAQRVAKLLNYYLDRHLQQMPMNGPFRPIPIVLYSDAHTSNGNVGFPPLRSHWYNKPAPLSGREWYDILAVHEGRHMVQYNQLFDHRTGRLLHLLFGEAGVSIFSGLFLPRWYYEGDAVVAETDLTPAGRGRNAAFNLWWRTDLLTNTPYSYDRAMLGTGFDRVPYQSPYVLGYFFNRYLQNQNDEQVLDRVIDQMATPKALSFDQAIKQQTQADLNTQYQLMTQQMTRKWREQRNALALSRVTVQYKQSGDYWQSWYPIGWQNDALLAIEVDIKKGASLVRFIDGHRDTLTAIPKTVAANYYSSAKSKAAFVADERVCFVIETEHPRQVNAQSAQLQCWNDQTGWKTLLRNTKLTSANYSHGQFLAHRFLPDRSSELVLYNDNGDIMTTLALPKRSLAYDITPSSGGWVFVMQTDDGQGIFHVNGALTDLTLLLAAGQENLRSPLLTNNWLLFTSDATGIDQVMGVSRHTGERYQVLTRPYGSYFLNYRSETDELVLSDYTALGQQIVASDFSDGVLADPDWSQLESPSAPTPQLPDWVDAAHDADIQPYRWRQHAWNPHSWYGLYDGDVVSAGLQSTDVLQTLNIDLSLGYSTSQSDWLGAVQSQFKARNGTEFGARLQRGYLDVNSAFTLAGAHVAWPVTSQQGISDVNWRPQVDLTQLVAEGDSMTVAGVSLLFQSEQEQAFHAIASPLALTQQFATQIVLQTQGVTLFANSTVQLGLSPQQALEADLYWQVLQGDSLPMLQPSTLFPQSVEQSTITRAELRYRLNLGPVGRSYSKALYWRDNEVAMIMAGQWDDSHELALGTRWQPGLNILRNGYVNVKPSLSLYYKTEAERWQVQVALALGVH